MDPQNTNPADQKDPANSPYRDVAIEVADKAIDDIVSRIGGSDSNQADTRMKAQDVATIAYTEAIEAGKTPEEAAKMAIEALYKEFQLENPNANGQTQPTTPTEPVAREYTQEEADAWGKAADKAAHSAVMECVLEMLKALKGAVNTSMRSEIQGNLEKLARDAYIDAMSKGATEAQAADFARNAVYTEAKLMGKLVDVKIEPPQPELTEEQKLEKWQSDALAVAADAINEAIAKSGYKGKMENVLRPGYESKAVATYIAAKQAGMSDEVAALMAKNAVYADAGMTDNIVEIPEEKKKPELTPEQYAEYEAEAKNLANNNINKLIEAAVKAATKGAHYSEVPGITTQVTEMLSERLTKVATQTLIEAMNSGKTYSDSQLQSMINKAVTAAAAWEKTAVSKTSQVVTEVLKKLGITDKTDKANTTAELEKIAQEYYMLAKENGATDDEAAIAAREAIYAYAGEGHEKWSDSAREVANDETVTKLLNSAGIKADDITPELMQRCFDEADKAYIQAKQAGKTDAQALSAARSAVTAAAKWESNARSAASDAIGHAVDKDIKGFTGKAADKTAKRNEYKEKYQGVAEQAYIEAKQAGKTDAEARKAAEDAVYKAAGFTDKEVKDLKAADAAKKAEEAKKAAEAKAAEEAKTTNAANAKAAVSAIINQLKNMYASNGVYIYSQKPYGNVGFDASKYENIAVSAYQSAIDSGASASDAARAAQDAVLNQAERDGLNVRNLKSQYGSGVYGVQANKVFVDTNPKMSYTDYYAKYKEEHPNATDAEVKNEYANYHNKGGGGRITSTYWHNPVTGEYETVNFSYEDGSWSTPNNK